VSNIGTRCYSRESCKVAALVFATRCVLLRLLGPATAAHSSFHASVVFTLEEMMMSPGGRQSRTDRTRLGRSALYIPAVSSMCMYSTHISEGIALVSSLVLRINPPFRRKIKHITYIHIPSFPSLGVYKTIDSVRSHPTQHDYIPQRIRYYSSQDACRE
jgi:hypothetical protein